MSTPSQSSADELLRALGRLAAEQERGSGDELEALVRGELAPDKEQRLEQDAATNAQLAYAVAVHRPLDSAAKDRISNRIAKAVHAQQAAAAPARRTEVQREERVRQSTSVGHARWRAKLAWFAVPLAAAAALALWLLASPIEQLAALPDYSIQATGGQSTLRGKPDDSAIVTLVPTSRLTLTLRPATSVQGPVAARAFLSTAGGLKPVHLASTVSAAGAVRLSGSTATLRTDHRGVHSLWVVVGRPETLATKAPELAAGKASRGEGWQRFRIKLRLNDAPR